MPSRRRRRIDHEVHHANQLCSGLRDAGCDTGPTVGQRRASGGGQEPNGRSAGWRRRTQRRTDGRRGHLDHRRLGRGSAARRCARLGLDDAVVRQRQLQASVLEQSQGDCCSAASRSRATRSATSTRTFYCEVRKHYGFVWFEMQHSTMSWDEVAKMIAACPGPDGAAPMIRMPDQLESSIQKATDLGAIGLIFPTIRDGHQALEAARYSRYPPFGRRSSGVGTGRPGVVQRSRRLPEHLQRQHARRRDARDARRHPQRGRDREHLRHRRGHSGQQRSVALLRVGAERSALPGAADGQPQRDAAKPASSGAMPGSSTSPATRSVPDVRFVQNGPAMDGWTPPARGRGNAEEPTIGVPGGRGRGRGAGQ